MNDVQRNAEPWYLNPDRKCRDDQRFTERLQGRGRSAQTKELLKMCERCPVLDDCFYDALEKRPYRGFIQGGHEW